jgi:hypothetical protein
MHHPDIFNILSIIEDYFLLLDDNKSIFQIEPISFDPDQDRSTLGIRITRQLFNGYFKAEIIGRGKDDNTVTFKYSEDTTDDNLIEINKIDFSDYSTEEIRTSVRNILILDKERTNL